MKGIGRLDFLKELQNEPDRGVRGDYYIIYKGVGEGDDEFLNKNKINKNEKYKLNLSFEDDEDGIIRVYITLFNSENKLVRLMYHNIKELNRYWQILFQLDTESPVYNELDGKMFYNEELKLYKVLIH